MRLPCKTLCRINVERRFFCKIYLNVNNVFHSHAPPPPAPRSPKTRDRTCILIQHVVFVYRQRYEMTLPYRSNASLSRRRGIAFSFGHCYTTPLPRVSSRRSTISRGLERSTFPPTQSGIHARPETPKYVSRSVSHTDNITRARRAVPFGAS